MKYLITGLDFTHDFMYPGAWYVTVGTGGSYAGAVRVMNGLLVFLVYIVFHLVTGDTELQCVGRLHSGIESTPENHTDDHKDNGCAGSGS